MRSLKYKKLMEGLRLLDPSQATVLYQLRILEDMPLTCSLQIWNQDIFAQLTPNHLIRKEIHRFLDPVYLPPEILGKKSIEIIISKCQRYCLKVISEEDFTKLENKIEKYKNWKFKNQDFGLIDILGIIVIHSYHEGQKTKWTDIYMLMPNAREEDEKYMTTYDIKGHLDFRNVTIEDFKIFKFGKDQNFIKSQHQKLLENAAKIDRNHFFSKLEKNINFLKEIGVIDYSLLLIFIENSKQSVHQSKSLQSLQLSQQVELRWCLIDYLQQYNDRKKLQNRFKSLFLKDVSCVNPQAYAKRLLSFIQGVILKEGKQQKN